MILKEYFIFFKLWLCSNSYEYFQCHCDIVLDGKGLLSQLTDFMTTGKTLLGIPHNPTLKKSKYPFHLSLL